MPAPHCDRLVSVLHALMHEAQTVDAVRACGLVLVPGNARVNWALFEKGAEHSATSSLVLPEPLLVRVPPVHPYSKTRPPPAKVYEFCLLFTHRRP